MFPKIKTAAKILAELDMLSAISLTCIIWGMYAFVTQPNNRWEIAQVMPIVAMPFGVYVVLIMDEISKEENKCQSGQ